MSGEDREVDSNIPETTFDKSAAPVQAVQTQPDITEFDEARFSYDRATLYIAGVTKNTKESQLRELFVGYGQIKNITLFPNHREFLSLACSR
jgi:RNA recognition motif. (a.k.a. RRM, RBD, or RNP domain)